MHTDITDPFIRIMTFAFIFFKSSVSYIIVHMTVVLFFLNSFV